MRKSRQILFVLVIVIGANIRLYASCCSSIATGGVGKLLAHERAFVEIGNESRLMYGSFDNAACFNSGHNAHLPHLIFEHQLIVMTRLLDFFEPFVKIPMRIQVSEQRTGSNLADLVIGARIPIFKENVIKNMPSLTLSHQTRLPTGAVFEKGMNNEMITSTGAWLFSFGFFLEKYFKKITWGLGYSLGIESAFKKSLSPTTVHSPLFTVGFSVHERLLMALSIAPVFHSSSWAGTRAGDHKMPDSDRRKLTIASSYVYNLHSHIKLNGQIGTDVPIDYLGKNFNNEVFIRLGMRFGIF